MVWEVLVQMAREHVSTSGCLQNSAEKATTLFSVLMDKADEHQVSRAEMVLFCESLRRYLVNELLAATVDSSSEPEKETANVH